MAKLPNQKFNHKSQSGETMEFTSSVTLDADGTFNLTIPDELVDAARDFRRVGVGMTKPKTANFWRASGKRLDDCIDFIKGAMGEHLRCEVTTERVIVYAHSAKVAYAIDADGRFFVNGRLANDANGREHSYRWGGELNGSMSQAPMYSVGIAARAYDKVTYTRPSGSRTVYNKASFDGSHLFPDTPGALLNGFIGLSFDPERGNVQEMPYSDDAAQFFYEAMLAMCKLAEQINSFLGNKEVLKLAIERRAGLMLAAPASTAVEGA